MSRSASVKSKKHNWALWAMMAPGLVYILINNYVPMFGVFIAFKSIDYSKGIFNSPWVGFQNFEYLFKTDDAFIITRNTLVYNFAFIILDIVLGIAFAIMLNEIVSKLFKKLYQTVLIMPQLISMVIASYLVFAFLSEQNGFLNKTVLPMMGMKAVSWYNAANAWPFILILVHEWKTIGFSSILYLSSIVGIDKEYYESAMIDGAGKWKQIWYITLPCIKPTVVVLFLISVGRIFYSDFGLFYQIPMNSGALYNVTNTIDTYVYRGLMQLNDISMSSAAGLYQSVVGFIIVVLANLAVRKIDSENALF